MVKSLTWIALLLLAGGALWLALTHLLLWLCLSLGVLGACALCFWVGSVSGARKARRTQTTTT
jgi:membrane protein DedA with SNARE-associated domain